MSHIFSSALEFGKTHKVKGSENTSVSGAEQSSM